MTEPEPGGVIGGYQEFTIGQRLQVGQAVTRALPIVALAPARLIPGHNRKFPIELESATREQVLTIAGPGHLTQVAVVDAFGIGMVQGLQILAGKQVHHRGVREADGDPGAVGGEGDGEGLLASRRRALCKEVKMTVIKAYLAIQGTGHQLPPGVEVAPVTGVAIVTIAGHLYPAIRGPDADALATQTGRQEAAIPGKAEVVDDIG